MASPITIEDDSFDNAANSSTLVDAESWLIVDDSIDDWGDVVFNGNDVDEDDVECNTSAVNNDDSVVSVDERFFRLLLLFLILFFNESPSIFEDIDDADAVVVVIVAFFTCLNLFLLNCSWSFICLPTSTKCLIIILS